MSAVGATRWSPLAILSSGMATVRERIADGVRLRRGRRTVTVAIPAGCVAREIVVEAVALSTVYVGEFVGPTSVTVTGPLDRLQRPTRIGRVSVRLESAARLPRR